MLPPELYIKLHERLNRKRFIQLAGMLTSEYAAERATAAGRLSEMLREADLTWSELVELAFDVPSMLPPPEAKVEFEDTKTSWADVNEFGDWKSVAHWILDYQVRELAANERRFVEDILDRNRRLSDKQMTWLKAIFARFRPMGSV